MSAITVKSAILSQIDHLAEIQEALQNALSFKGDDSLWLIVDGASDVNYENTVKGETISVLDSKLKRAELGSVLSDWLRLHNTYFSTKAGISGVTSLISAIENHYGFRVHPAFHQLVKGAGNTGFQTAYIFPRNQEVGSYTATGTATGTFTPNENVLDITQNGLGVLQVTTNDEVGVNNLVLSITGTKVAGTPVSVTLTIPSATPDESVFYLGSTTTTADYTTGGTISVDKTGGFVNGDHVLVKNAEGISELAVVQSLVADTSLTLRSYGASSNGLRNTYLTGSLVIPLFASVTAVTNSNGNNGDVLTLDFVSDRELS